MPTLSSTSACSVGAIWSSLGKAFPQTDETRKLRKRERKCGNRVSWYLTLQGSTVWCYSQHCIFILPSFIPKSCLHDAAHATHDGHVRLFLWYGLGVLMMYLGDWWRSNSPSINKNHQHTISQWDVESTFRKFTCYIILYWHQLSVPGAPFEFPCLRCIPSTTQRCSFCCSRSTLPWRWGQSLILIIFVDSLGSGKWWNGNAKSR